jgi:flagellar protein FliO/FliZ
MLELADFSRAVIGLGVVLSLMAGVFWLLRRFAPAGAMARGGGRRLALVESLPLDPRTRLVLVRHDDREHLVMISSTGTASLVQSSPLAVASGPEVVR